MREAIIYILLLACVISSSGCGRSNVAQEQLNQQLIIDKENSIVSYLGPEGTYTQEACGVFFDNNGSYLPFETVNDAVEAMEAGKTDYAVIPQENTIGGAVTDYVDIVIAHADLSVVGEVELPINQNLLVVPGATLDEIKTVYSHKQGIAQGKDWLSKNLPNVEVIEVSSTAEGARLVSEAQDKSIAAIASAACADVYGLGLLATSIQENNSNKTRFYVLSKETPFTAPSQRLAFIASGSAEDLPSIMNTMKAQNIKLVAIHDRPMKTELGNYHYIIECADCSYQSYNKIAEQSQMELRFLGCFNEY